MAIIRSRDELLPVTCAVLKDSVREAFFNAIKKKTGNRMERVAAACNTTVLVVTQWSKGQANPPYHALQRMASEFGVEVPEVSELRREFYKVEESKIRKPSKRSGSQPEGSPSPAPPSRRETPRPEGIKPEAVPAPPPEHKPRRSLRRSRKSTSHLPSAEKNTPARPKTVDAPSDERAYWSGVLLARAWRNDTEIRLEADRRMSQNFAVTWAHLTENAFGLKPELVMSEDRRSQTAVLPAEKLAGFLDRMEFRPGISPLCAPGAPRWAWSNKTWTLSFLRGIVDASAQFQRTPALRLTGLSEKLSRSAHKMLTSLDLVVKTEEDHVILLEGKEAVSAYCDKVGTDNPKLKDQMGAYFKTGPRAASEVSRPPAGRRRQRRGRRSRPKART